MNINSYFTLHGKVSDEKQDFLEALGATTQRLPSAANHEPLNYRNVARTRAEAEGWTFGDQHNNLANLKAHRTTTYLCAHCANLC